MSLNASIAHKHAFVNYHRKVSAEIVTDDRGRKKTMASHTRTPVRIARTGMVAAAHPLVALIGVEILRAGGNATDAAVAISAALAVTEPHSSPLEGDTSVLLWDAQAQKLSALKASAGAGSVWRTALEIWGTLTAAAALAPAITLAEDGFALSAAQPELAQTLNQIAEEKTTEGEVIGPEPLISEPTRTAYRGIDIAEILSGTAENGLGQKLRALERIDFAALSPESAEAIHRLAGASKQQPEKSTTQTAATHCVIDARGNAVAWTSSSSSESNLITGPWMLFRGETLWAVGGDADLQTNLQIVTQLIDSKRSPQEAIESPKWHTGPDGIELSVEDRLPLDTCYELRQRGYALTVGGPWSGACAAQVIALDPDTGILFGGSDPRVEGLALGY